jgi:sec-independent protein translocase protein TatA
MFGNFGLGEWLIVILLVLILFGAKKIPDLAQGLGKGIKEFKKAIKDVDSDEKDESDSKKTKKE